MRNDSFYQSRDKQTSRKLRSAVDPQHFTKFNLDAIWDHFTEELDKTKKLAEEACQSDGSRLRALLHMQVTQLTSILDFYMHELGRYVMVQIFMGCWPRNKQYQSKRYDFFVPEIEGIILSGRQEEDTFRDFIGLKENAQSYIQPGKIQKLFEVLDISYQSVCDQTGYGAHTCTCILQDFGESATLLSTKPDGRHTRPNPSILLNRRLTTTPDFWKSSSEPFTKQQKESNQILNPVNFESGLFGAHVERE